MKPIPPSRTLIERHASCPLDERVLPYYAGVFEAVYVIFHPFVRPTTLTRERLLSPEYLPWVDEIAGCEPVTWEEARIAAGLPSIAAVDIALRTGIGGLGKERRNETWCAQLEAAVEREGWIEPNEGFHPAVLVRPVLEVFKELGHSFLWLADTHDFERIARPIEQLLTERHTSVYRRSSVFAHDHAMLWTVHWDSHFSFLCGSRADLDAVRVAERFEGFFCDETTEVYWSVWELNPPNTRHP